MAVSNKVAGRRPGGWLAVDGRVLYKANVTLSETYNTLLEAELVARLGVAFAARPDAGGGKRAVREMVGRRPAAGRRLVVAAAAIEGRRRELAAGFQAAHGRPPTAVEAIALAQQATLETRQAKHAPRGEAEQRRGVARRGGSAVLGLTRRGATRW